MEVKANFNIVLSVSNFEVFIMSMRSTKFERLSCLVHNSKSLLAILAVQSFLKGTKQYYPHVYSDGGSS